MVSDHAKEQLVTKCMSDSGVLQISAAHATLCMLLAMLTILVRTIGAALWFVQVGGREEKGQKEIE